MALQEAVLTVKLQTLNLPFWKLPFCSQLLQSLKFFGADMCRSFCISFRNADSCFGPVLKDLLKK